MKLEMDLKLAVLRPRGKGGLGDSNKHSENTEGVKQVLPTGEQSFINSDATLGTGNTTQHPCSQGPYILPGKYEEMKLY